MSTLSKMIKATPGSSHRIFYNVIPFRYRYHNIYRKTLGFINQTQWWSIEKLKEYQLSQLKYLCNHAYDNTVYYKKIFDNIGMHPQDLRSINDLKHLPYLTKNLIRENYESLIAKNINENIVNFSTSGSTGSPFKFEGTDSIYKKEAAFVTRAYSGHQSELYSEKSVWIRRYNPQDDQPIHRYDYELRRLYLSPFHLNMDNAKQYVDLINNYGANLLNGYPSSIYILARVLDQSGLKLRNIERIHCASEKMLDDWNDYIEQIIGITPKSHYGMVEKVAFFHQCQATNHYHENLEYGVTEFEKINNIKNMVVGTSFLNFRMPLIRYVMNDTAILNNHSKQCGCGIGLPLTVKDFMGRSDDLLFSDNGGLVPGPNFYTMMYKIPGVDMFRIIQDVNRSVNVLITTTSEYDSESHKMIMEGLEKRLGNVKFEINEVKEIKRDQTTGKIRCIVNKGI